MATVAGGTAKNGTMTIPYAQAVVRAVLATVHPTLGRSVHRAIDVKKKMKFAVVRIFVTLTIVKHVWTVCAEYAEATSIRPAARASVLIFTRICAVAVMFADSPAATTGLANIALTKSVNHAFAKLLTMKN